MKEIIIYDYANRAVVCGIPDKPIASIDVFILTGDELITVNFEDGTTAEFDSSDCRLDHEPHGVYTVSGEALQEWLSFVPPKEDFPWHFTVSYLRRDKFTKEEE